jgi:enoyl-CoA hydratase
MTEDLLTRVEGAAGFLTLNRPKALHALTAAMVAAMTEALVAWQSDPAVELVIIEHLEGSRGFCAGGDIAFLRNSVLNDGGASGRAFFYEEYQLNHLLFTYPKPVAAVVDGIAMGGGVGISAPAKVRVATENTRFAMPETGIGLFPDVGGGWFLARLSGRLGQYLALTGARLDGAECLWAGLATHYAEASALAGAKQRIAAGEPLEVVLGDIAAVPPAPKIAAHAGEIAQHFASDRYEDILTSLAADTGDWAQATLKTLGLKSPQSCKVSLNQLAESARLTSFADNMALEYRMASRVLTLPDFAEGVRALIIDKTHDAKWDPPTPEAVSAERIESIFAPLPPGDEWQPLAAH